MAARPGPRRVLLRQRDEERSKRRRLLARTEGIIPALESAHAIHEAIRRAPAAKDQIFVVNLPAAATKIPTSTARTSRNSTLLMTSVPTTRISRLFERLTTVEQRRRR